MSSRSLELLNRNHNLAYFDCGNADLDGFLKEDALENQNARLSVTRLILQVGRIVGFLP